MWTSFVKIVAYISLVGGMIASIVLAAQAESFLIFIVGILVTAVLVSGELMLVEISENIATSRDYLYQLTRSQTSSSDPVVNASNSRMSLSAAASRANNSTPNSWQCSHCGKANPNYLNACQGCKQDKQQAE